MPVTNNFNKIENRLIESEFYINPEVNEYFQNERYGLAYKILKEENKYSLSTLMLH